MRSYPGPNQMMENLGKQIKNMHAKRVSLSYDTIRDNFVASFLQIEQKARDLRLFNNDPYYVTRKATLSEFMTLCDYGVKYIEHLEKEFRQGKSQFLISISCKLRDAVMALHPFNCFDPENTKCYGYIKRLNDIVTKCKAPSPTEFKSPVRVFGNYPTFYLNRNNNRQNSPFLTQKQASPLSETNDELFLDDLDSPSDAFLEGTGNQLPEYFLNGNFNNNEHDPFGLLK